MHTHPSPLYILTTHRAVPESRGSPGPRQSPNNAGSRFEQSGASGRIVHAIPRRHTRRASTATVQCHRTCVRPSQTARPPGFFYGARAASSRARKTATERRAGRKSCWRWPPFRFLLVLVSLRKKIRPLHSPCVYFLPPLILVSTHAVQARDVAGYAARGDLFARTGLPDGAIPAGVVASRVDHEGTHV